MLVPVVLAAVLFVVQFGLAYHGRQVLAGAAQDGAAAGARQGGTPDDGATLTRELASSAGDLLRDMTVTASGDGDTVTVLATARVVSLLPFMDGITVRASATAKSETFDAQGEGP